MQKIWQQNEGRTQNDTKEVKHWLVVSLAELSSPTLECMTISRLTATSPIPVSSLSFCSFQGKTIGSEQ